MNDESYNSQVTESRIQSLAFDKVKLWKLFEEIQNSKTSL